MSTRKLVAPAILTCVMALATSHLSAAVIVTSGTLTAFSGYTVSRLNADIIRAEEPATNPTALNPISLRLDLGSVFNVARIDWQNRRDVTTSLNALGVNIYVMSNESQDATVASNYSISVYSGNFELAFINGDPNRGPSVWRAADITDVSRRNFRLELTSNFNGALDGLANVTNLVDFGDVAITVVPEPSSFAMIVASVGVGVAFYFRRRRAIRS